MKHFFLDTNVLLDFILRRDDFGPAARQLFEAASDRRVALYISALSFSHIYYVLRTQDQFGSGALASLNRISNSD